jgi:hypothetical protein
MGSSQLYEEMDSCQSSTAHLGLVHHTNLGPTRGRSRGSLIFAHTVGVQYNQSIN